MYDVGHLPREDHHANQGRKSRDGEGEGPLTQVQATSRHAEDTAQAGSIGPGQAPRRHLGEGLMPPGQHKPKPRPKPKPKPRPYR